MTTRELNKFGKQTRDILVAYLATSGLIKGGYSDMFQDHGGYSTEQIRRIAASLKEAEPEFKDASEKAFQDVPKNATLDVILNFLRQQFSSGDGMNWDKIITSITLVGTIISKVTMGDVETFKMIGSVALLAMEYAADWVDAHGGWFAVVEYVKSLDIKTVAVAVGIGALLAGAGYLLWKNCADSKNKK